MSEVREIYRADAESIDALMKWGEFAKQSGVIPQNMTAAQAAMIIQTGRELGLPPAYSLRNFSFINGRIVESTQNQWARAQRAGVRLIALNRTKDACEVILERGGVRISDGFSIAEAHRAGLIRQGSAWEKYPDDMLFWAAIRRALRKIAPDITAGLYAPDEIEAISDAVDVQVIEASPEALPEPEPEPATERPQRRRRENGNWNGDAEIEALKAEIATLWRELYPAEEDASHEAFRILLQQRYNTERLGALTKEQLAELKADLERERSEAE